MGDDRYCYLNISHSLLPHLLDEADEALGWDLPDDEIKVPSHLLPAYQDEDDETILPSASHPSYPYGNPHLTHPLPTSLLPNPLSSLSSTPSLATTLPNLSLKTLFQMTNFNDQKERHWNELGLDSLLEEGERSDEEGEGDGMGRAEGTQPTGQNAGDHPIAEGEDDEMGIDE